MSGLLQDKESVGTCRPRHILLPDACLMYRTRDRIFVAAVELPAFIVTVNNGMRVLPVLRVGRSRAFPPPWGSI